MNALIEVQIDARAFQETVTIKDNDQRAWKKKMGVPLKKLDLLNLSKMGETNKQLRSVSCTKRMELKIPSGE